MKVDTTKLFAPGEWGWRIVLFDLRMPNGQMVEWYLPIRELEEAKDAGHVIFERWRNATVAEIAASVVDYTSDVKASRALYQAAFDAALSRMGFADEAAARADVQLRQGLAEDAEQLRLEAALARKHAGLTVLARQRVLGQVALMRAGGLDPRRAFLTVLEGSTPPAPVPS